MQLSGEDYFKRAYHGKELCSSSAGHYIFIGLKRDENRNPFVRLRSLETDLIESFDFKDLLDMKVIGSTHDMEEK